MATSSRLTDEETRQLAENLRTKYIQEHSDDIDPRDLKRLQVDLHHALKFIKHNRGNFNNAFNNMVESYKWRKSFGINDIKYEDIDESMWKSGMALNHGFDREGNPVAILNIHMHRKDAKKAPMLQKWIAFCYEMHCRVYPDKKMLMVFDMTGAGLAQMDMDLVRFVVNSFKIYFPNILAALLVYNMPWVLQAAWKIVQGWLSEGAASKVKFVTKENIQEFIAPENLLVKYGGYDQWEYDFEVEKEYMMQLINSYHDVAEDDHDGDISPVEEEEEEEEEGGTQQRNERRRKSGKQVHFSSGLPPTRQSRYGRQDEDEIPRSVSPEQQMLQKGSSTSNDVRRRQVTRLMSLQDSGKDRKKTAVDPMLSLGNSRSSVASLMTVEELNESANGTPPPLRRNDTTSTIGDLEVSPGGELQFVGKKEEESMCILTLTNTCEKTVAYKIKTTAPLRYKVKPNLAMIAGQAVAQVKVVLTAGSPSSEIFQDKFLVQTYTFDVQNRVPTEKGLTSFWKSLPHKSIKELRMHCRRVSSSTGKSDSLSGGGASPGPRPSSGKTAEAQVTGTGRKTGPGLGSGGRSFNIEREVARLVEVNNDLCKRMSRLQKLNYFTVLLLLVLIAVVCIY